MSASIKVFLTLLGLFCATTKASATKSCEFSVRQLSYNLEENFVLEKVKSKKRYDQYLLKTQVKEFSATGAELIEYQFDFYQTHQGSSKEAKPLIVLFPTSAQLELWEQMGRPERQLLNSGHGASVLRMHLQRSQVLEFIQNQL